MNENIIKVSKIRLFIDLYLKGTIKLNNKTSITTVQGILDKHDIPHSVLQIVVARLTKEEYAKLSDEIVEFKKTLKYVTDTTTKQMYLNDLNELKKLFKDEFQGQEYV